jgi:uncharacterized membrane protein YccC
MSRNSFTALLTRYRVELWQVLAIVLATLLSFLIASWLNLAEPFWSVITAAIVARITARGAVKVAAYRLLGTLAGALFGLAVAFARSTGLAEPVLLVILVAPLALISVIRPELRAALIAGIIVFSAAAHLSSPIAPALARIIEVGLGAIIAAIVSIALGMIFRPDEKNNHGRKK